MARPARRLTKPDLDRLRARAQVDPTFAAYVSDAAQAGLYAWARRGKVTFVYDYRPPGGGARRRMLLDVYGGGITLDGARRIAAELRQKTVGGRDPQAEREQERREATTFGEAAGAYLADFEERVKAGRPPRQAQRPGERLPAPTGVRGATARRQAPTRRERGGREAPGARHVRDAGRGESRGQRHRRRLWLRGPAGARASEVQSGAPRREARGAR